MVMRGCDGSIKAGTKELGYIDTFNINVNIGNADTSQIGKEWAENIATSKDWSGSASGTFDYSETSGQKSIIDRMLGDGNVGTPLAGEFKVSDALTVSGNLNITDASIQASHGDKVSISFNFKGTGKLEPKAS